MDLMTLSMMKNMSKNGGGSGPLTLNTLKQTSGGFVLDMTDAEDVGDGYVYSEELNWLLLQPSNFLIFIGWGFTPLEAKEPSLCTFFVNGIKEIFTLSFSEELNTEIISNESNSIVFTIDHDNNIGIVKTSENIVYTFTKEITLLTEAINITEIEDEDSIFIPISNFFQENTSISNFTLNDIINSFKSFFGVAERIINDDGELFVAYVNNEKFYIWEQQEEENWHLYFFKDKNIDLSNPSPEKLEFFITKLEDNDDIIVFYPGKEKYLGTTLTISSYHEESTNFYKSSKSLKIWDNIVDRPKVATTEEVMLTFTDHISLPGEGEAQ